MGLLKRIKYWCSNDWILVWSTYGQTDLYEYGKKEPKDHKLSYYKIFYSKSRNKYKLEVQGYKPKEHKMYYHSLVKLAEFNRSLIK